ncbi:MAG: DNA polymerase Y family protein [Acidobacteriia bacterium]|nr:DNA polymerase Y family protein [Terriglobia bacterium]
MFAALYIPDFPVEAIVRAQPELRGSAVTVVEGTPPMEMVCALNDAARALGIEIGMTKLQAQARDEKLELRKRSPAQEAAAHAALLDCAQAFSPRVEDTAADTVILDLAGLAQLFGSPAKIAHDLARRASEMGLETHVGVASNPDAATHAAQGFAGVTVIPPGKEAERLGPLPIDVLAPAPELFDTLDRWGVRNLRALGALPEVAVTERLGQEGLRLQRLARGATTRDLAPCEPPLRFEEMLELEYPVDLLEPLAFALGRLLEQLCARLGARALATNELRLAMELAPGPPMTRFERTLRLPVPMLDSKVFLKLLQLDLKSHPPGAPVAKVTLAAEPVRPRFAQGGLFLPLAPEPERLELTLARISGVVGEGNVGAAELLDTHRPDAFRMLKFMVAPCKEAPDTQRLKPLGVKSGETMLALRVFRPPLAISVDVCSGKPARVRSERVHGEVVSASGPWRISGEWWKNNGDHRGQEKTLAPRIHTDEHGSGRKNGWAREEWDIAVVASRTGSAAVGLYRIYCDENGVWFAHGEYD